jgi:plasmid maintenance system antidote protein VapI
MGDWTEKIRREETIYPPVYPGEGASRRDLYMEFLEPIGTWHPTSSPRAQACPRSASAASWCAGRKQRSPLIFPARLDRYFGMGEDLWARVQACYDLQIEEDRWEREAR